ncbi:hypothetical protein [Polaromonas sp.]|uniref:hypothetical protein n=1 Tax=Polaromonas sp. TaxID=1869339 RepID=UPI0017A97DE6|nr:hypothetical protein [Polaromonas sp.]NML85512.1 hypothetical protein [Polaromonas sp.]
MSPHQRLKADRLPAATGSASVSCAVGAGAVGVRVRLYSPQVGQSCFIGWRGRQKNDNHLAGVACRD